jgi:aryl-alcohol dehydrogenase-like predicted oxidoreductase
MRYKLLGRSGLRVSELCLGTMTFGEDGGWGAAKQECARILDAFAEAGGNFIDTANAYTNGSSEQVTGELVAAERAPWVLATKYTVTTRPGDPNAGGSHRKSMVQALDASLRRLGTDYVDVYWLHVWDVFTPVEEIMRALDDLVRAGKVLYVRHLGHTSVDRVAGQHAGRAARLDALRRPPGALQPGRTRARA